MTTKFEMSKMEQNAQHGQDVEYCVLVDKNGIADSQEFSQTTCTCTLA